MIEMDIEKFQVFPIRHLKQAAEKGETLRLYHFGEPVAEVKPLPGVFKPRSVPQLGSAQGLVEIRPDCFDPLPDDLLDAFEGKHERIYCWIPARFCG